MCRLLSSYPSFLSILCSLISIVIFAIGFFPFKPFLSGFATCNNTTDLTKASPPFDKVIFMVVDALRSDFVYANDSGFWFTKERLVRSGAAVPFTAHAGAPTVTMPRIKAITTGSVPSFLDAILNIAESDTSSTLINQDTWLSQIKSLSGRHLIMYGDDTWLKLFPQLFGRYDGTTSFFVSDFIEVDMNVTRHISSELLMDDWSVMVLHYLGLDHIGHKMGPRSKHMVPKQQEMDAIIKEIYTALESQQHLGSTLLVLCGDHGMNDAGNHGGASLGETSPALVFISPKFKDTLKHQRRSYHTNDDFHFYRKVDQSDISPTLAGLLGFPIPLNSVGVFIPEFLPLLSNEYQKLKLLFDNSNRILNLVKATYPMYHFDYETIPRFCSNGNHGGVRDLQCRWAKAWLATRDSHRRIISYMEAEDHLLGFARQAQKLMSSTAGNYNIRKLYTGIIFSLISSVFSLTIPFRTVPKRSMSGGYFALIVVMYSILTFSSSYVEEEQHFWYWVSSMWIFYLCIRFSNTHLKIASNLVLFLGPFRLLRRWNQTGQKFSGAPDISNSFLPNHTNILWVLNVSTFIFIYHRASKRSRFRLPIRLLYLSMICMVLIFKIVFTVSHFPELMQHSLIVEYVGRASQHVTPYMLARLIFFGFSLSFPVIYSFTKRGPLTKDNFDTLYDILTLFLITQSRTSNIPIFLLFHIQLTVLTSFNLSNKEVSITSLIMQYTSFFAFGGSNSISSIDLSNAYNGIKEYNVLLVGILTFVGNWAGPIWWVLATHSLLLKKKEPWSYQIYFSLLSSFVATNLLAIMTSCTILRTHLFVWTVFSPKFLYCIAWALGQFFGINTACIGLVYLFS